MKENLGCTCEPGVNSMNDCCSFCRQEFEEWCDDLQAQGLLGNFADDAERYPAERVLPEAA